MALQSAVQASVNYIMVAPRKAARVVYFISSPGGRMDECTKYTQTYAHLEANRYEQEATRKRRVSANTGEGCESAKHGATRSLYTMWHCVQYVCLLYKLSERLHATDLLFTGDSGQAGWLHRREKRARGYSAGCKKQHPAYIVPSLCSANGCPVRIYVQGQSIVKQRMYAYSDVIIRVLFVFSIMSLYFDINCCTNSFIVVY